MIRAAFIGVTGQMGRALLRAAPEFPELAVSAAVTSPHNVALGRDAGELAGVGALGVALTADLACALGAADVALDFSVPAATGANLAACRAARKPLLIGTTGLAADLSAQLGAASRDIALLVAPNTSVAVTLLIELVRTTAGVLPPGFDIDVLEAHHRGKQDAPSGTALALAAAARAARKLPPSQAARPTPPYGPGRREGEIGFSVVRAGDLVGEHQVRFCGPGEQLCLTHRASDRAIFARGALTAALWLASRPPGRYAMRDLLGIKTET